MLIYGRSTVDYSGVVIIIWSYDFWLGKNHSTKLGLTVF